MRGSVLITGGSGFIGSHLVRRLVADGAEVHAVVRDGTSLWRLQDLVGSLNKVDVDLADAAALRTAIDAVQPAVIFHLAGATGSRRQAPDFSDVKTALMSNLVPTLALVEAAALAKSPPKAIIRAGSAEEYGQGASPHREDQRESAASSYSATYLAASHFWQALQPRVPFTLATLRIALTYGPAQAETFLVPSLIRACLEGRDFALTAGSQVRDYIYVDDVVEAFIQAAQRPAPLRGKILNISTGKGRVIRDVADQILQLSGGKITLTYGKAADRAIDVVDQRSDPTLAHEILGWKPTVSMHDGLARTIAWYAENPVTR